MVTQIQNEHQTAQTAWHNAWWGADGGTMSCTKLHERQPAKSGDNYCRDWRVCRSDGDTDAKKEKGKGVELFANVRNARLGTQRWRFTNILLPFEEQSHLSVLSWFTGRAKDCGRWLHTVHLASHQSQFL